MSTTSPEQGVSAKWQLAQAALNILVARESQAQVRVMKDAQEEMTEQLNVMMGDSEWERGDLFDFFHFRDAIGASQLSEYLPDLSNSFTDRHEALQPWRQEVRSVAAIMLANEATTASQEAVLLEGVNVFNLLRAVYVAEEHLGEMLCY